MLKNREQLYRIYHAMLSMALTWALALAVNQYFVLKVPIILSAVFSFLLAGFVYLFDIYKKNAISYILLGSILPLIALIFWIKRQNPIRLLGEFLDWCMRYNGTKELYISAFAFFAVLGVALMGAVFFYIITKKQLARVILAVIILSALLLLCVNKAAVSKVVVGISIFYIMTIIVELYGFIYSRKEGRQDKKEGILYLAPVCLLLAVLSVALPSKLEPIQWTILKNTYRNIKEQLEVWQTDFDYYFGKGESEFFVSLSGYSEEGGSLDNGELTLDERVAMKLTGLNSDDTVYLTGSVSDIYTGYSWEKSRQDYLPGETDYLLDYMELFFCMSRQSQKVLEDNSFVKKRNIKVSFYNIKTKTFFYPLKISDFNITSSYRKLAAEPAQITFKKARGRGTSYQSIYYEMNLKGEAFQEMLRQADSFSYGSTPVINLTTANWLQKNTFYWDKVEIPLNKEDSYEVLQKRAEIIKRANTALPEELPDRVKKLALDITADYDTTYDKLKAIEAYLLRYTYTLKPGKTPENRDFTDYFLFESKAGYCTSFATAMAVLGRCIGVPTRYVEGFVVKGSDKLKDDICEVKNSQAHAWAEAYIEGVGWIPFEATAAYYNSRYIAWPETNNTSDSAPQAYDPSKEYGNQQQIYEAGNIDSAGPEEKKASFGFVNAIAIFFAVAAGLMSVIVIYYYILRYRYRKSYEKSDNSNRMYLLFLRILELLMKEGFTLGQQETILMLSGRVKEHFRYDNITFREVADIFMRYRYAEKEVTEKQLMQVHTFHLGLLTKRGEEISRFRQWLEEYIFLIQTDRRPKHQYSNM